MTSDLPVIPPATSVGSNASSSSEPQYGGFWVRLGAMFLDFIIASPFILFITWTEGRSRPLFVASQAAYFLYHLGATILLVKWRGGSPGKLLWGLKVLRIDLKPAGWKEAWLRETIALGATMFHSVAYMLAVARLSEHDYFALSGHERYERINELGGIPLAVDNWLSYIWMGSEVIILLTNRRRRALHDFIAGTVVVREGSQRGCGMGLIVVAGLVLCGYLMHRLHRH